MKHKYYVKHNGVLYAPGTDVPEGKAPVEQPKVEETKQPEVTENIEQPKVVENVENAENTEQPNTEENAEAPVEQPTYTRTQIQQMNGTQLRETATQLGVEFGEDTTNKELKQMIMGKLGI